GLLLVSCSQEASLSGAAGKFESIRNNKIELREFVQAMPKGGDLHNHLFGAVYAESILRYAEEDGMCIDADALAVRYPGPDGCGALSDAKTALAGNQDLRNRLIDQFSIRDFVPSPGWSGHDQFFRTFGLMAALPYRFADMTAEAANNAGRQNITYLELLHTMELFETILPMVGGLEMTGDPEKDYKTLMASEFGQKLPEMVARAKADMEAAMRRKDELLGCGTDHAEPGCKVVIRFQNQPVRTLPLAAVYAHTIFGWQMMQESKWFVGTNLVAPEDDFISLRDYDTHMAQIDYLYKTLGPRNISLHAGELWLGLVHPEELRDHIRKAVEIGHAKRIGHGTDITFEDNYKQLLAHMAKNEIMVEINLTSSEVLLGITADAHPLSVYRKAGVPVALSSDDEGVARIDLTHEYVRAVNEFDLSYADLKEMTYNSLKYAFADEETKAAMIKSLDERFAQFESQF
ncbi:MAG TPA: adenosine deaminase, partial [Hellea balneolensis]|nr:adenosine deaminase [Hellea balneolensis]